MNAAIDCGTNSTRLLVADDEGRPIERLMEITRLGQGVDATGALDPAAIERTVDTLRRYRAVMDRHGVERVRITATVCGWVSAWTQNTVFLWSDASTHMCIASAAAVASSSSDALAIGSAVRSSTICW